MNTMIDIKEVEEIVAYQELLQEAKEAVDMESRGVVLQDIAAAQAIGRITDEMAKRILLQVPVR